MAISSLKEQIMSQLERLTAEQQRQVLDYASKLGRPRGTPGHMLVERLKNIHVDSADLEEMEHAIEEECERIDEDGWEISL